jgi:hypothetical protein
MVIEAEEARVRAVEARKQAETDKKLKFDEALLAI